MTSFTSGLMNKSRDPPPVWVMLLSYLMYAGLLVLGYGKDFLRRLSMNRANQAPPGYCPLISDFEDFYRRNMYNRIQDCWNRPIQTVPGPRFDVMVRESTDAFKTFKVVPGQVLKNVINLASYNYLGFAQTEGKCIDDVERSLNTLGVSTCGPTGDLGYTALHRELEKKIANFVGKEDAVIFGMGFATNSTVLPALASKGTLIISDSLNHASLVVGARGGAAKIRVFQHGDVDDLRRIVRESIIEGQPRTHRPWDRIWILVEGIYSMEGHIVDLPAVVAIKKEHKCYLYVDEAHSIGALGNTGRGVCEHFGVNPDDVDILMGTFTKSFGSVGGYISGSKELVDYLRHVNFGSLYSCSMAPGCVRMALSALEVILGQDGTDDGVRRIHALRENSNYFRDRLIEMGFMVIGDHDSPIVPVLTYIPTLMPGMSRECLKRGLGAVVVGFPATAVLESRCRFCISAAHTRADLDEALAALSEVGDLCMSKFRLFDRQGREEARQRLAEHAAKAVTQTPTRTSSSSKPSPAVLRRAAATVKA